MSEQEGIKPVEVSLDALRDKAIEANQTRSGLSPLDRQIEMGEEGEGIASARLAAEVKGEREKSQGLTDAEAEALADAFLKEHGFGEGIDPDLK